MIRTTVGYLSELLTTVKRLEAVDSAATEFPPNTKWIRCADQMFSDWLAGRSLKRTHDYWEPVPWLHGEKTESKYWHETYRAEVPFRDHSRFFVARGTRQRIFTIQPYIGTVGHDVGVAMPREFLMKINMQKSGEPLGAAPVVVDTLAAISEAALRTSREFADKHGLRVTISHNGWYNPFRVLLIEYTKGERQ
jgi:hypothetical protein